MYTKELVLERVIDDGSSSRLSRRASRLPGANTNAQPKVRMNLILNCRHLKAPEPKVLGSKIQILSVEMKPKSASDVKIQLVRIGEGTAEQKREHSVVEEFQMDAGMITYRQDKVMEHQGCSILKPPAFINDIRNQGEVKFAVEVISDDLRYNGLKSAFSLSVLTREQIAQEAEEHDGGKWQFKVPIWFTRSFSITKLEFTAEENKAEERVLAKADVKTIEPDLEIGAATDDQSSIQYADNYDEGNPVPSDAVANDTVPDSDLFIIDVIRSPRSPTGFAPIGLVCEADGLVSTCRENGAATQAGLKVGDIVVRVDGEELAGRNLAEVLTPKPQHRFEIRRAQQDAV